VTIYFLKYNNQQKYNKHVAAENSFKTTY